MKRVCLYLVLMLYTMSINARIEYNINKYGVMMVNFVCDDKELTTDLFKSDWDKAIDIALSNQKVTQVQFKNVKGEILTWIMRNDLSNSSSVFDKLVSDFSNYDEVEIIYGDSVLERNKIPAQYHKDTYLNGKLESQFSSDWNQGYFKPTTSTYKSGNNIYRTETYYTPVQYNNRWKREIIERKVTKKGETKKLEEIYKKY